MQARLIGAIYAFILLFSLSANAAAPSEADLKGRLAFELPRTWQVSAFTVTISQDMGSETSPLIKSRFDATIKAKEDFYKHSRWADGGVEVIQAIVKKGDELPLYGDATSTKTGSIWNVKFAFEKKVHEEGKTRSNFSSNAVILGSSAEKEITAKQNTAKAKIAKANADAEAARRANADELTKAKSSAQAKRQAAQNAVAQEKAQREVRYQQLLAKYNPKKTPGRLSNGNHDSPAFSQYPLRAGDVYYFEIENAKAYEVNGGDPYYTATSFLEAAALHTGILTQREKAIIKVTVVKYNGSLLGSPQNGVKSTNVQANYVTKALLIQAVHDRDYNEVEAKAPVVTTQNSKTLDESGKALEESVKKLGNSLKSLFGG